MEANNHRIPFPEERIGVLSTAHIPEGEAPQIADRLAAGQLVGMQREEGFILFTDIQHEDVPVTAALLEKARHNGFDWLMLDADGDILDELPTYNWKD